MNWRTIAKLAGPATLAFGLVGAIYGVGVVRKAAAIMHWPSTRGTVETSATRTHKERRSVRYSVDVTYSYEVLGVKYRGSSMAVGGGFSTDDKSLSEFRSRCYPVGSTLPVYYNPDDPSEAYLERTSHQPYTALILSAAALMFGTMFTIAGWAPHVWNRLVARKRKTYRLVPRRRGRA